MSKFFVDECQVNIEENIIRIYGDDVNHIKNVLRMQEGEDLLIVTKSEPPKTYKAKINKLDKEIECFIIEKINENTETDIHISVFQGIPKSDKMELIIQKCTELGVKEFVPLELNRCIAKIDKKDGIKKQLRWQKIAETAAKQCGRSIIPKVNSKINLKDFCKLANEFDLILVAYEQECKNSLKEVINNRKDIHKIAIIIGPEGGLEQQEIKILKDTGAEVISLGTRILRTETAPIVLTTILMYEFEEFNLKG